jgi:hypothetical protein
MKIICPGCGKVSNCSSCVDGSDKTPKPGDIGFCIGCATIFIHNDDKTVQSLSEEEYAALPAYILQSIARLQDAMDIVKRRYISGEGRIG